MNATPLAKLLMLLALEVFDKTGARGGSKRTSPGRAFAFPLPKAVVVDDEAE